MAELNHAACLAANEAFWGQHPELSRRQLTLANGDAALRQEWHQLYAQAQARQAKPPAPRVLPDPQVAPPKPETTSPISSCPIVMAMTHEQKMEEAIKRSDIWPALKDQVNLPEFVATMVATSAGLALVAATGYGAAAEAIGAGLLVVGGLFSGYQIGGGMLDLVDFFQATRCDVARTPEDLDAAAKKFSSGVAKMGVGGLFLLLGVRGAKGKTWRGKPIEPTAGKPAPVPRLTEAELDAKFGSAKPPVEVKAWEKNTDGSVVRNPTVREVKPGADLQLNPENPKNPQYIWLIDENGKMFIAEEVPHGVRPNGEPGRLGHPTLIDGKNARIGGELSFTEEGWVMNNKSGRYSGHDDRGAEQLNNAAAMMRESGIDVVVNFLTPR